MTTTVSSEYGKLTTLLRELDALDGVQATLQWDELVMLPKGSVASRGEQSAALAAVVHEKATAKELGDAIAGAEKVADDMKDVYVKANIRDARRDYEQTVRVSRELVMEQKRVQSASQAKWVEARKSNDWNLFAPLMRDGLRVSKQIASARRPDLDPYDAALDQFERGMTVERLQKLFDELAEPLKKLLDDVNNARDKMPPVHPNLRGGEGWEVEAQSKFVRKLAEMMTFDFERGRMDASVHPFTAGSGQDDIRITTRYNVNKPFEGIIAAIHEVGHGIYEQGRNSEQKGLPVSKALSIGAHESQSLFWERMVGRGLPFWKSILSTLYEHLPVTKDATADDLNYAVNQVDPKGLIRVSADELSYPFHIMLRFEIERGLFDGSIDVDDVPKVWNEKMKKYFDVDVPDYAQGCLQDIHWSVMMYGYFPTYTLGAMTAAQLYAYMDKDGLPGMEERIARGEFKEIREFLNEKFHELGSLHPSLDELLVAITGEPLKVKYFMDYLSKKYSKMYNLP